MMVTFWSAALWSTQYDTISLEYAALAAVVARVKRKADARISGVVNRRLKPTAFVDEMLGSTGKLN